MVIIDDVKIVTRVKDSENNDDLGKHCYDKVEMIMVAVMVTVAILLVVHVVMMMHGKKGIFNNIMIKL